MAAFIVFEGGEGAGKSTQARLLARHLSREGYRVVSTREPGGTGLGEAARRWLKTRPGLTPLAEILLISAARAQHVKEAISPALNSGQIVVCDRFTASSVAYQGYGRGLELELIHGLNKASTGGLEPDLTLFMEIPVKIGLARKKGGQGDVCERDVFESEAVEFHERVRAGYLAMASEHPDRWRVVDGTLEKRDLARQIWTGVKALLRDGGGAGRYRD